MTKHLLKITDLNKSQIEEILRLSVEIGQGESVSLPLQSKNIIFAFEKPSLRTKVGTETAINKLGGNVIHVDSGSFFGGQREDVKDTVKNVNQWADAVFARVFKHQSLVEIAKYSEIPVINALCDLHHPMQALADLLTIQQVVGVVPCAYPDTKGQPQGIAPTKNISVAFVGDANNVARSLLEICLIFGYDVRFAGPKEYFWSEDDLVNFAKLGGNFSAGHDPQVAVKGADFVYTDTFISMGEEEERETKLKAFADFQVNSKLLRDAYFMHCLPAHRGEEVTDEVIDSAKSLVYKQAKNRMVVSLGVFAYFCYNKSIFMLICYAYLLLCCLAVF